MDAPLKVKTSWGIICVTTQNGRVTECSLPLLANEPDNAFRVESDDNSADATRFIIRLLSGVESPAPTFIFPTGTAFQQSVWSAIAAIPFGQTRTYGELAASIKRPQAVRAVGTACGRNPLPLFIPCHRVVAAGGGLGGFSSGLAWKRLLLQLESRTTPLG